MCKMVLFCPATKNLKTKKQKFFSILFCNKAKNVCRIEYGTYVYRYCDSDNSQTLL